MPLQFLKMHGAGNDFAVFDARSQPLGLGRKRIAAIAQRRTGVGCDQLIVLEPSSRADCFMRIYNADGSESGACGNATRCIAWLLSEESGRSDSRIETPAGVLSCTRLSGTRVRADMGEPNFDWQRIASRSEEEIEPVLARSGYGRPTLVDMGNPHAVFFVPDVNRTQLEHFGPLIEKHAVFRHGVNVSVAQLKSRGEIILRVWERGSGLTLACGTAACAALVAGFRRGLTDRAATVRLPGGDLQIEWDAITGHVMMTGEVELSFSGLLP